eukprot:CAMPEP_0174265524 /NCGR_PEP_ID=MMETSP0439-20130205/26811_1 /TAXON_ID=0 /ORGANISM="Stereomyxa ramosa, Strain Chinc5" /LENGTH=974 /DNA_ID=CAMNT_0015352025 /DNA_START=478 /DNA_END=3399 /DNA_ORIENTATION=+
MKWGRNRYSLPVVTFAELFKEQALAPFFVFQILCVILWTLSEYWYYSLLTFVLLVVFESTLTKTRLNNINMLREMSENSKPKEPICVYRNKKWEYLKYDQLLPGDIIALARSRGETICPCDLLLLYGSCVVDESMLTGESIPQLKESIERRSKSEIFSMKNDTDRLHVIYGGTSIVKHTPSINPTLIAPNGGVICYVLRTGFYTTQGKLLRTIIYSSKRVTANTKETLSFILVLLAFAFSASSYVMYIGLQEKKLSIYQLALECCIIITSVVPPELPTELSLAVTTSLKELHKHGIFCTEPFRIPTAGKIDVCCFDKTGTLTSDELVLTGIAGLREGKELIPPKELEPEQMFTLAGCHSLIYLDGKQVGDPMEIAALNGIKWAYTKGQRAIPKYGAGYSVHIVRRFPFSASLKRMSTIISLEHERVTTLMVTMKGAPETMRSFFCEVPDSYEEVYKYYSSKGMRVLAMGYKPMHDMAVNELNALEREDVEESLKFGGFMVFKSLLKPESAGIIATIKESSHNVVMITGDNMLTACEVAKDLSFFENNKAVILTVNDDGTASWNKPSGRVIEEFSYKSFAKMKQKWSLCATGAGLDWLSKNLSKRQLLRVIPNICVWGRASPVHKEIILLLLKDCGLHTLMCGDGTNDVGALKQADVGVAMLSKDVTKEKKKKKSKKIIEARPVDLKPKGKRSVRKRKSKGPPTLFGNTPSKKKKKPFVDPQSLKSFLQDGDEVVALGDASIASPFTTKCDNISPVVHIIRQGRATLVATMQIFKILALNCLISAYSLSILYLDGVKLGDMQATVAGTLIAMCFLFISQSQPLEKLSKQKPISNLFSFSIVLSVIGQFLIHLYAIMLVVGEAKLYSEKVEDLAADFEPNVLNSGVFLISTITQVFTFAINYRGHPFMSSLLENTPLLMGMTGTASLIIITTCEVLPDLNWWLQLVPLPTQLKSMLLLVMLADFVCAFLWDRAVIW